MQFYPMMILAMGGIGITGVILKERETKLDSFLFVAGIKESVYVAPPACAPAFAMHLRPMHRCAPQ